jgi:hypothetical protein
VLSRYQKSLSEGVTGPLSKTLILGLELLANPVVAIRLKSLSHDQVIQYDFPPYSARFLGFGYLSA